MPFLSRFIATSAAVSALVFAAPVRADLTLTAAGVANGFTLSLFVDQVPASGFCCGPLGITTNSVGQVVLQVSPNGRNYVFADVDHQHFGAALSSAPYASLSYGAALANSGGALFATNADAGGVVYRLNGDGSIASALTGPGAGGHGLWTNPATGHLVSATGSAVNDIDPVTGSFTTIVRGVDVDGVSVSGDGSFIYGATEGRVFGWNYAGTQIYDSGVLGHPDGTGVIQAGSPFAGSIVANSNDGTVWLLNPSTQQNLLIAEGGSRGDYVGIDHTNGSLFLTQTDSVYRLGCGAGCSFATAVPEPATNALLLAGLGVVGWAARRRRGA